MLTIFHSASWCSCIIGTFQVLKDPSHAEAGILSKVVHIGKNDAKHFRTSFAKHVLSAMPPYLFLDHTEHTCKQERGRTKEMNAKYFRIFLPKHDLSAMPP